MCPVESFYFSKAINCYVFNWWNTIKCTDENRLYEAAGFYFEPSPLWLQDLMAKWGVFFYFKLHIIRWIRYIKIGFCMDRDLFDGGTLLIVSEIHTFDHTWVVLMGDLILPHRASWLSDMRRRHRQGLIWNDSFKSLGRHFSSPVTHVGCRFTWILNSRLIV